LERLQSDKHSSLLGLFISGEEKSFVASAAAAMAFTINVLLSQFTNASRVITVFSICSLPFTIVNHASQSVNHASSSVSFLQQL
jgi:hypothetical protein